MHFIVSAATTLCEFVALILKLGIASALFVLLWAHFWQRDTLLPLFEHNIGCNQVDYNQLFHYYIYCSDLVFFLSSVFITFIL